MNKKLLKIFNLYGDKHQLKKLKEEQKELREAIKDYQKSKKNRKNKGVPTNIKDHVLEEIADNFVLLGQFINGYEIPEDELKNKMKEKITRTINEYGHEREGR